MWMDPLHRKVLNLRVCTAPSHENVVEAALYRIVLTVRGRDTESVFKKYLKCRYFQTVRDLSVSQDFLVLWASDLIET